MSAEIRVWEPVGPDNYSYELVKSVAGYYGVAMTPPGSPERAMAAREDEARGVGWWVINGDEKFKVHKVEATRKPIRIHAETTPPFGEWREVTA
ncbi:hypothetical protein [Rhodococcus sp. RDE2]|uniref:hypothetical protein n=1 Tax=Rhodococcus sp. RDE2 TaxID=2885078 RepID=UPI001E349672|nr:hypothetical protein [Rhodococcus sp. RDE2]BDB60136.1 hypothetical protein RDE2_19300 [Rhodococcus sp. RDE2]